MLILVAIWLRDCFMAFIAEAVPSHASVLNVSITPVALHALRSRCISYSTAITRYLCYVQQLRFLNAGKAFDTS